MSGQPSHREARLGASRDDEGQPNHGASWLGGAREIHNPQFVIRNSRSPIDDPVQAGVC